MNQINSRNIKTVRLELRIPTMNEQNELWTILVDENVNKYYFPTPDRIFTKNNLDKSKLEDLIIARKIFQEQLSDWIRQEPFYKAKVESIQKQEDSQKFTWSIFLKETGKVIGQITCQPKDDEPADIRDVGWYIDPDYQGNGYATEAAEAVLDFMFNEVEISEIHTSAASINPASWRIMEKMGFKYVGDKKSSYFNESGILLSKMYEVNKELFINRNNTIKQNNCEE